MRPIPASFNYDLFSAFRVAKPEDWQWKRDAICLPDESRFLVTEQFPRQMLFEVTDDWRDPNDPENPEARTDEPKARTTLLAATPNHFPDGPILLEGGKWQGFRIGQQFGDTLEDIAYEVDGYRFHDCLHIALAGVVHW